MTALRTDSATPENGKFSAAGAGAVSVGQAFKRALVSQCHPTMLFAVLLPFLIALVGCLLLLYLFWTPLNDWLALEASRWDFVNRAEDWMLAMGLFSLKLYL
ncbi:MAG: EI24 domain-containing protein, partial [Achromobacter pestifer]